MEPKRYRLTITNAPHVCVVRELTGTEQDARDEAQREIDNGAVCVRIDTDLNLFARTSSLVTTVWRSK